MAKRIDKEPSATAKAAADAGAQPVGGNITRETFLEAQAEITEATNAVKAANERRKATRKKWKANGIELGVLDAVVKMAEWDRSEVRANFDNRRRYAEFMGLPYGTQPGLFEGMSEDERGSSEWYASGKTAKLAGFAREAPDTCPDRFQTSFLHGYDGKPEPRAKPAPAVEKSKLSKAEKEALAKDELGDRLTPKGQAPKEDAATAAAFAEEDAALKSRRKLQSVPGGKADKPAEPAF